MLSIRIRRALFSAGLAAALAGCQKNEGPPVSAEHTDGHGSHSHAPAEGAEIVFEDLPAEIPVARPFPVAFHLRRDGHRVDRLRPTHEKLVHLILVRDGFDRFQHLHPEVTADGRARIDLTVPEPGLYHVYADFLPEGGGPSTARTALRVGGDVRPAERLRPTVPGEVTSDGIKTEVSVEPAGSEGTRVVSFRLADERTGKPVRDLEPYLGALGHLVVIEASTKRYIHAHPEAESDSASEVSFYVHASARGLYAGWAQFQRSGTVATVPFAFEVP